MLSTYLNWSDLKKNHNKFYIQQVLQRKGQTGASHPAMVFTRYGRVGVNGVISQNWFPYEKAVATYHKTMRSKKSKGYTEIIMANDAGGMRDPPKAEVIVRENSEIEESTLDSNVQTLVKFFFDQKLMESSIVSVNVDIKKMPLGQLSRETVFAGYKVLREIEDAIEKGKRELLADLSGRFYTVIPHNFGMKKMSLFIISTAEQVREKLDLITNLLDIQVA